MYARQGLAFLVAVYVYELTNCVSGFCWFPGRSQKSQLDLSFDDYLLGDIPEETVVTYSCLNADSPKLIGEQSRICRNGEWTGDFPRCATKIPNENITVRYSRNMILIAPRSERRLDLLEIKLKGLKNLTMVQREEVGVQLERRNWIQEPVNGSSDLFDYTFSFDLHGSSTTMINLSFSDFVEGSGHTINLYAIIDDDCESVDMPHNSFLVDHRNDSGPTVFTFGCLPPFKLESNVRTIACGERIYWQSPKPKCVPTVACQNLEDTDLLKVGYNAVWNKTHSIMSTVAYYSCKLNNSYVTGMPIRECLQNGTWSGDEPKCVVMYPSDQDTKHLLGHQRFGEKSSEAEGGIGVLTIVLAIGLFSLLGVIGLVAYKSRYGTRVIQRIDSRRSTSTSRGITGKRFKLSYKMGMNIDDDFNPPESFNLKTPTEDRIFDLRVPSSVHVDHELENDIMQGVSGHELTSNNSLTVPIHPE